MADGQIEGNVRAAIKHLLDLGQPGSKKNSCFIAKVALTSHGGFVRTIAQSEYWLKPTRLMIEPVKTSLVDPGVAPAANTPTPT